MSTWKLLTLARDPWIVLFTVVLFFLSLNYYNFIAELSNDMNKFNILLIFNFHCKRLKLERLRTSQPTPSLLEQLSTPTDNFDCRYDSVPYGEAANRREGCMVISQKY